MSAPPQLSIGLPVYNGETYLAQSIEALLGQTYEDFELIISDNGSTDATADICQRYELRDPRIRYIRQPHNIGAAPNHAFVLDQARGELFKWASADDLYARDLLKRCVAALDENDDVVLAHSRTAEIDAEGQVTQVLEYPLATYSPFAPERFRSMLFGSGGDDIYGVIRTAVLRRIPALGSYYHSDRTFTAEIALQGRFYQVPDWLYFRRDHGERPQHTCPTVRTWCTNLDPRRANRVRYPAVRLLAEYVWGFVSAVGRAPLSPTERRQCYGYLAQWIADGAVPVSRRVLHRHKWDVARQQYGFRSSLAVETVVAGQERLAS